MATVEILVWYLGLLIGAVLIFHLARRGIPKQKVIMKDPRPTYDECGCIFPCPDHKSPRQDARRDREYWTAKESQPMAEDDQEEG